MIYLLSVCLVLAIAVIITAFMYITYLRKGRKNYKKLIDQITTEKSEWKNKYFDYKSKEPLDYSLEMVREFHTKFEQPVLTTFQVPDPNRVKLRLSLMLEELAELAKAAGYYRGFSELLFKLSFRVNNEIMLWANAGEKVDLIEVADALGDIEYVWKGLNLEFGSYNVLPALVSEIHRSNMSKACPTLGVAEETARLSFKSNEPAQIVDRAGQYFVYRDSDKKLVKSVNYSPADIPTVLKRFGIITENYANIK